LRREFGCCSLCWCEARTFAMLMSRIAFYAINITGLFMIMHQDEDDPSSDRKIFGFVLIGIGTIGIIALNFWPRKQQQEEPEEAASEK
jgi:hypothetical protein